MAVSRFAPPHTRLRPAHIALAAAVVVLGAALRGYGARGEMWLDEIWSLETALAMGAWYDAFWTGFSDNSHPLNSVWMHLMGAGRAPWVYRLSAIMFSTLTIAASGWAVTRRNPAHAPARLLTAMVLSAALYPFVHFGSEARGYAGMMLFLIFAFAAAEDGSDGDTRARWRFALWGGLALYAHLASVPVMVFLALGHGLRAWLDGGRPIPALNAAVRLSAPYVAVLTAFSLVWMFDLRAQDGIIQFGGGTDACDGRACFTAALGNLVRYSTGGTAAGESNLAVALTAALTIGAVAWLAAVGNRRWVFYAAVLVLQPLLFLALAQPGLPYGRYFLGMFVFWPLLMGDVMGELGGRGRIVRGLAVGAVAALVAANAYGLSRFYQMGRGDYRAAFDVLREDRTAGPLTIGTNMVYQFQMVFDHVARDAAPAVTLHAVPRRAIAQAAPKWVVTVTVPPEAMPDMYCAGAHVYRLVSVHPFWGFSGSHWGVYQLTPGAAPPAECPSVLHPRTRFP